MNEIKQAWQRTQLSWDDKESIQTRRIPRSLILNWRKMTHVLRWLCEEKHKLQGRKLLVLDIGCGAGRFWNGLESAVDLCIGVDPSDKMLDCSAISQDRFFIRGAGEQLPVQSGIADLVLIKSVLDQCYEPSQVISEARRVLKNGGWLLISLSNKKAYYALLRSIYNLLRRHKSQHFFQDSHQFYFGISDISTMLGTEKFEIARKISLGYFMFPRFLERLVPERAMLKCIDLADKVGKVILPSRGGIFILVGELTEPDSQN